MEFSDLYKTTGLQGGFPSPDGTLIASVNNNRLTFRSTTRTNTVLRVVTLAKDFSERIQFMGWSSKAQSTSEDAAQHPNRFFLADEKKVDIYDALNESWTATVNQGYGGIKAVDFGRDVNEIVIVSDFQLKLSVWSLVDSEHVDILHPKFLKRGHGHRSQTSHFALLSRPATQDVITIHEPSSYKTLSTSTIPTLDAQGLSWSPCGRWIVVWDSPVASNKLFIFSSDGSLFKTFEKPAEGLGIKSVEWSPTSEHLAVGCYDGSILCLNRFQFLPVIEMRHNPAIKKSKVDIWSEEVSGDGKHSCIILHSRPSCTTMEISNIWTDSSVLKPVNLPVITPSANDTKTKTGVSVMTFNCDGSLLASHDGSMLGTVWIWSLTLRQPIAILVHLSSIKSIQWHPLVYNLLLITCAHDNTATRERDGMIYLWKSDWSTPRVFHTPMERVTSNLYARWIPLEEQVDSTVCDNDDDDNTEGEVKGVKLVFGDKEGYIVGNLTYQEKHEEDELDYERDEDSQGAYVDDGEAGVDHSAGFDMDVGLPEGGYVG